MLWWLADDPALDRRVAAIIEGPESDVSVSAVSAWEIEIKRRLGKLDARAELLDSAPDFRRLAISFDHAATAGALPLHHRDPFDRMLVAQAQLEGMTIVTADERIARYDVHVLAAAN